MDLNQLRQRYNDAAERVAQAATAIETAEDGADIDALQRTLDEAVSDAERAQAAVTQAEERQRAVERFQPLDVQPAPQGRQSVQVGTEEAVYRPDVARSFFGDLMRARTMGDGEAAERIDRHDAQMRDLTTGAGADGIIPPQYLSELYVDLPRESRPVADAISSFPLPSTGMTITIPRLATGVTVASQATENSAVSETDLDTDQLTVPVRTIAGMQDASRQSLDRSDPGLDRIIMSDLVRAYDQELDRQIVTGSGASGQHTGLLTVGSTISVTYTDASPTAEELLPKAHDALQQMWTQIFKSATHVIMHPRRAAWLASAVSANSPIFPQPQFYAGQRGGQAGGFITSFAGLPVIIDANVPTNLGGGTNEDRIIFINAAENPLMEGPLNMAVESSPMMNTLTVRFVAYAYSAFASNRRVKAIAVISGTGLVAPAF